ncbi:MAG: helix-turn-helix domain-containing protein [Gemmatimonadota bacterium]
MRRYLTIGEAAKRLGLEVDTVRKLERTGKIRAVRTRGGHRRFTEEEVDRFRKSRRRSGTSKAGSARPRRTTRRAAKARPTLNRHPGTGEFTGRDVYAADDMDDFEDDLPFDEFDEEMANGICPAPPMVPAPPPPRPVQAPQASAPRAPLFEPRPAVLAPTPATDTSFADRLRLQTIKGYGRAAIPRNLPGEWQGRVIAELERYVTVMQFPADLSYSQAEEIVRARVTEVLKPYHEAEEKAARQKRAKEEADRRRAVLIAHGIEYARRETIDWDYSATTEARDEVKKVLEREVEHDWTEREVEGAVDEVLDEWDDDDEYDDD